MNWARRVQIVEEDPSYSSRLLSMRDVEVLVAPGLERRVVGLSVLVAGVLEGLMEVDGVFLEEVVGSEIGPSSEPRSDGLGEILVVVDFEVADVEVTLEGEGKNKDEKEVGLGIETSGEMERRRRTVGARGLLGCRTMERPTTA